MQAAGETFVTPLALQKLDGSPFSPFAIADQCVQLMIGAPKVFAIGVRAGEAISGQVFIPSSRTFTLQVGNHIGSGLHRLEFDTHSAARAVMGCLRFPGSVMEILQSPL